MSLADEMRNLLQYSDGIEEVIEAYGDKIPRDQIMLWYEHRVSDDVINAYDSFQPTRVEIHERERMVRSRVVGLYSPGGTGSTTLGATMAYMAALSANRKVAIVDLNEQSDLPMHLGLQIREDTVSDHINPMPRAKDSFTLEPIPHYSNRRLFLYTGVMGFQNTLSNEDIVHGVESIAQSYPLTLIDCPQAHMAWEKYLALVDNMLIVLRLDASGLNYIKNLYRILHQKDLTSKVTLVGTMDGARGFYAAHQFTNVVHKAKLRMEHFLPYDEAVASAISNNQIVAETIPNSAYCKAVGSLLEQIGHQSTTGKNKGGLLAGLTGLFKY